MILKIALGVLIGAAAARWIRRRRCGGHFGWHHGRCHGRGGGRRLFWLARDLDLTPEQVDALRPLWLSARNAMGSLRFSHLQSAHALFTAATAEPLDRARLDQVAERHAQDQAQAGRDLVDAVAKVHEVLTPEQREKL